LVSEEGNALDITEEHLPFGAEQLKIDQESSQQREIRLTMPGAGS